MRTVDDAFETMGVEVEELIEIGDDEVVVRDGAGYRFRWFKDPDQGRRAAGIEPG